MSVRLLTLTAEAQAELEALRDRGQPAYLRERAAALLKIAAGQPAYQVAQSGLFKARAPDTVYAWLDRYEAAGIAGLRSRPGRGRKPVFSPSQRGGGGG